MAKTNLNEDKIALLTGCFIFLLAALNLAHLDVLGWVVSTNMWTSMDKAFSATTGAYKGTISGVVSLLCTYVALTAILSFGIKLLGGNVARFVKSFTVVFFISEICYMFGANAHIAATPDAQAKYRLVDRPDYGSGFHCGACRRYFHQQRVPAHCRKFA